jgi:hypothetical protein
MEKIIKQLHTRLELLLENKNIDKKNIQFNEFLKDKNPEELFLKLQNKNKRSKKSRR